jgi:predicted nucleotidyltransferase
MDMELQRPLSVIAPTVSADVLTVLAKAEIGFTPPEIHRLVGDHSINGVRKALEGLTLQGIVTSARVGQAVRYELNRDHITAPYIIALAQVRDELLRRLTERIESWTIPCRYAALFGSAARNDMRLDSDIDLFIVRATTVEADDIVWEAQVEDLESSTARATGNDVRTLHYSEEELQAGLRAGDRVLADIRRDGVRLTGPPGLLRPSTGAA